MGCRLTKLPVVSGLPVVAEGWRDPAKGLLLTQVRFCDVASAAYKQYKGRIIELKLQLVENHDYRAYTPMLARQNIAHAEQRDEWVSWEFYSVCSSQDSVCCGRTYIVILCFPRRHTNHQYHPTHYHHQPHFLHPSAMRLASDACFPGLLPFDYFQSSSHIHSWC